MHISRPLLFITLVAFISTKTAAAAAPAQEQRDIAYVANGHARQKLDLFTPEKSDGPLPLIIWIHGGAWSAGSKAQCPPLRQGFTEVGIRRGYYQPSGVDAVVMRKALAR